MAINTLSLEQFIIPVIFIAGGLLLGIIFDKIIIKEIKKITARTKWEGDEVIIHALHGMTIFWFVAAGVYGAIRNIQMNSGLLDFFHNVLLVLVILSVTMVIANIFVGFVNLYSRKVGGGCCQLPCSQTLRESWCSSSVFSSSCSLSAFQSHPSLPP